MVSDYLFFLFFCLDVFLRLHSGICVDVYVLCYSFLWFSFIAAFISMLFMLLYCKFRIGSLVSCFWFSSFCFLFCYFFVMFFFCGSYYFNFNSSYVLLFNILLMFSSLLPSSLLVAFGKDMLLLELERHFHFPFSAGVVKFG